MIHTLQEYTFVQVDDQVKTEQTVHDSLVKNPRAHLGINYISIPLAHLINTRGIIFTQNILNILENKIPKIKTYVCQHIHVKKLNFYENIVYTPHTLNSDNLKVIPHYNPCISPYDYIEPDLRKYRFSFVGSYKTHKLRYELRNLKLKDSIVKDTGDWHFYKSNRQEQTSQYVNILCNTQFALCPPGTGVSTIRLYEAMAAGCTPIVFNDVKVPGVIEPYVIRIKNVDDVKSIEMINNSEVIHEIYWRCLSNEIFYKLLSN